jgi:hypothetical protein
MNTAGKLMGVLLVSLYSTLGMSQQPCATGIRIDGTITDQTGAVIPGASLKFFSTSFLIGATLAPSFRDFLLLLYELDG